MLARLLVGLVERSIGAAGTVVGVCLLGAVLLGAFAATHLAIDTDTNALISPTLPWRQREAQFDRAFPQNVDAIAVVIDAATSGQADDAASSLAEALAARPDLFKSVRRPDGGTFLRQNGLLLLSVGDVQEIADQLIAAQPLLGSLAADPNLRGVFSAITLALKGVESGDITLAALHTPLNVLADSVERGLAGRPHPIEWDSFFTGRAPLPQELRRFIVVQPVLDYRALEPGAKASAAIRESARALGLAPERGVRVRLTGSVALSDEEFATVAQGAGGATIISFVMVCALLFLALRSWRIILAIVATLLAGLAATAGFAALAVGALNLISVAFAVLFIGIAVDFSIQFSIRYRDDRHRLDNLHEAILGAARGVGTPLALAAATAAVGFLSFVPTDYSGVSELGLIAGTSMIIALLLNLTMLPAALKLLRPGGEAAPVGYRWAAPVDALLLRHRRAVLALAILLGAGGLALLPSWRFDFDPLNLKDPKSESVATLIDLMADPSSTPYTIDILAPSLAAAKDLAARLDALPEVAQTVSLASFIPDQQEEKLAILGDAATLLGPTLSPPAVQPPPDAAADLQAMLVCARALKAAADRPEGAAARRLAAALDAVAQRGAAAIPPLADSLTAALGRRLDAVRLSLTAQPVALETLPADLKRDWLTPDGRARLEVFPKGNARDTATLERFVAAVRGVAPDATGTPVTIQESGRTVAGAFLRAGVIAVIAIILLLALALRRLHDVALVILPLLLAGLLTVGTSVLLGLPANYANIIALPLLLGIGVAFDIYFVMRWRAGIGGPLQSSTARAVLFSALTTTTAFGSLALSRHPGTAEMGQLLTISLGYVLVCTLVVLPALLGPAKGGAPP